MAVSLDLPSADEEGVDLVPYLAQGSSFLSSHGSVIAGGVTGCAGAARICLCVFVEAMNGLFMLRLFQFLHLCDDYVILETRHDW